MNMRIFCFLKVTLFSNLAAANLKLHNFDGCRQCCNVVILFCNKPELMLNEMGIDDDLTQDILLVEPILPTCKEIIAKTLFRRGKCLYEKKLFQLAIIDYQTALRYTTASSSIKEVECTLRDVQQMLDQLNVVNTVGIISDQNIHIQSSSATTPSQSHSEINRTNITLRNTNMLAATTHLTVNGGPCLLRKAYWSQTVTEVIIYLPCNYLHSLYDLPHIIDPDTTTSNKHTFATQYNSKSLWKVEFLLKEIAIFYKNIEIIRESLEFWIVPSQCVWMIEDNLLDNGESHMVLHLHKAPYKSTAETPWFPGCEWWDRVFIHDERIDTMCCTVNTDPTQLPPEAIHKAEEERRRFEALSLQDREKEVVYMIQMKKAFVAAEQSTQHAAEIEDKAIQEVPERGYMLDSLRKEFPHIDFTAK